MIELSAMFPVFITEDLATLKEFYQQYFGFQAEFFDSSFYLHLLHPDTGTQLAFMVPDHASQPDFLQAVSSTENMVISFEVKDAKTAYAAAQQAKLDIVFNYKVEEFGLSHFMVKDPAGFIIDIVEHHESALQ